MNLLVGFAILFVLCVPMAVSLSRANELFVLHVKDGKVTVQRGRLPQKLVDDIADVVRGVSHATLKCKSEGRKPRLYARGAVGPDHAQRLRNLVGTWTVAQMRTAPKHRKRRA
jgi:hypothetical protein